MSEPAKPFGVSAIVCCHNSARLLPETLACLARQEPAEVPYEVIVIDNASTDGTAEVARASWPSDARAPLRVVTENELGLTPARLRGIAESRYEILCFVDDDNRVASDWVRIAGEVMSAHPEIAACGGQIEPVVETTEPFWFAEFKTSYAIGEQAPAAGDVTESRGYLWGAGLCLRKSAWNDLAANDFGFSLSDRKGKGLSSGGDAELCYALRLRGWRLWYEPRLRMTHFLPEARLRWEFVRRLNRGYGSATALMDAYEAALKGEPANARERLQRSWLWQVLATARRLAGMPIKSIRAATSTMEADVDVLQIENLWGRLRELLRHRSIYRENLARVLALRKPNQRAQVSTNSS